VRWPWEGSVLTIVLFSYLLLRLAVIHHQKVAGIPVFVKSCKIPFTVAYLLQYGSLFGRQEFLQKQ
jgi:hypothetical protein